MMRVTEYANRIFAVDADYVRPQLVAIHLVIEQGRAMIVDTGTNASVPAVVNALAALDVPTRAVDFVVLSHVHLDHAGGAGEMMRTFPNARLVVHPRGKRHMVDPSQLFAGTAAVYGEDAAMRLYGRLVPVDPARIIEAADGLHIDLAGRPIELIETPGHARHHVCVVDRRTRSVFTGDVFGLSYRELDASGRPSVIPTTTPVQFDPAALHASIDKLVAIDPPAAYLTHYGEVTGIPRLAADLHRLIEAHCAIATSCAGEQDRQRKISQSLHQLFREERDRQGWPMADGELAAFLAADVELNAKGLDAWLDSSGTSD